MIKKPYLILLAAGKITSKLPFFSSLSDCPALIPLGIKSSLLYQIDFYKSKVDEIIILTNNEHVKEIKQELYPVTVENKLNKIHVIGCRTKSVIQTINFFIDHEFFNLSNDYIINLSTSIPSKLIPKESFGLSLKKNIQQDWSSVDVKNGKINNIYYRNASNQNPTNAFIGIFRIKGHKLKEIIGKCKTSDLIEILDLYNKTSKQTKITFQQWFDVGHSSNYYDTKKNLILSRNFNSIKVDNIKGTVIKSSSQSVKIKNEYNYINKLPSNLKIYFPRLINGKIKNNNNSSFEMEYYAYPTLSETSLFWDINKGEWKKCFTLLSKILAEFKTSPYTFTIKEYSQFYYKRLVSRVSKYLASLENEYKLIFSKDYININNKTVKGFNLLLPEIKEKINSIYDKNDFCIMHGDFCFNNILYEPYSSAIKLIDVRGSFNNSKASIYGDQKYDFAKLSHSAVHYYDYLIAGQYKFKKKKNNFMYSFIVKDNYEIISNECNSQIIKNGYKTKDIDFIVGILFLSMTPLHNEDTLRQKIMFIHGLNIINKSLDS